MHSKDLNVGLIEVAKKVVFEIIIALSSQLTGSSTSEKSSPSY